MFQPSQPPLASTSISPNDAVDHFATVMQSSQAPPPRPPRRRLPLESQSTRLGTQAHLLASPTPSVNIHPSDLLLPRHVHTRSLSPSGDSILTITPSTYASKSHPNDETVRSTVGLDASKTLASSIEAGCTSMGMDQKKRNSVQRRLGALRDLVCDLDFNQSWSTSHTPSEANKLPSTRDSECSSIVDFSIPSRPWSKSEMDISPIFNPLPMRTRPVRADRPKGIFEPDLDLSTIPCLVTDHPIVLHDPDAVFNDLEIRRIQPQKLLKPISQSSIRTDPLGSFSAKPDPPRPALRARKEVFSVAWSGYGRCLEPSSPITSTAPMAGKTWRSTLPSEDVYHQVVNEMGSDEMKRQEIFWEMCETERGFVDSMKMVMKLFASPLKTPHGKWIDGIPDQICGLFDSLQSIINVHASLVRSQQSLNRNHIIDIFAFIDVFRAWVDQLSIHESFLLGFESVTHLIEKNVKDPLSVFGEFVRMQMKAEVLGSMSLPSMLLKPVQRLTKYPLFLKGLLDAIPNSHPAQSCALSLLTKTESMVSSVQAAKVREEDYQSLQVLESRILGLPEGFVLAVKGRKLLGHGRVASVVFGKDGPPPKDAGIIHSRARSGSVHSLRSARTSGYSTISSSTPSTSGLSSSFDFSASQAGSSRTSAFSISSFGSSFYSPSRSNSISTYQPSHPSQTLSRPPSVPSMFSMPRPSSSASMRSSKVRKKEDVSTMLVFDDIVVLGQMEKGVALYGKRRDKRLRVIEGGVGRVLEVKNLTGWGGHDDLLSLTLDTVYSDGIHNPITHFFAMPGNQQITSSPSLRSRSVALKADLNTPTIITFNEFLEILCQGGVAVDAPANGEKEVLQA
ncbi:hypothetical protein, variant 2 [Cryptococcus neoformans var. grubii H99]|nr:hypothetical protein, variant 2 [Cryptococcus neoformans var. grubii H99]AGV14353.1 hypothetical protein, variant 2 [Cryptococcus neoformans var. grubii H99]AUB24898.1 hypothetical protein CKF44_01004 [Cryptococcus neoformans var. grubii]|eukprot:XP_012049249.1 hypothetical protein, variant 2 [Cryptococcus neoformans var. grubii H99]